MKEKRSFYSYIRPISEKEREKSKNKHESRIRLGIIISFDSPVMDSDKYVPSMYSSIDEYEYDKNKADYLITLEKPVPKQLEQKLIAARIELENKGLLQRYKGN